MDAASKLEFCKSRHGEAIICHCSLLQSAHPSLSTSIVVLQCQVGLSSYQLKALDEPVDKHSYAVADVAIGWID